MEERNYREAIRIIQHSHIDSQAICSYLQRNGFEDIALHFVTEPRARFTLAIRCGNLEIALQCARELDLPDIWNSLAEEALKQGNHEIVEMAYQHTKAFDKLSFLYVISNNAAARSGAAFSRLFNCGHARTGRRRAADL